MKAKTLPILLRDSEGAERWFWISAMGFWGRHPECVTAEVPKALKGDFDTFRRYGYELQVLEHDLTECINEFRMACDHYYSNPDHLELKKFAAVYHVDNFYIRVHKLIENIYRLLGLTVDVDPTLRPAPGDPSLRGEIRGGLRERKFQAIMEPLAAFEKNKWIKAAVEARNLFVHRYREEHGWSQLQPKNRFREPGDSMARAIRRIDQATDLDRYAERKVADLSKTLEAIRLFRDKLFQIFQEKLPQLASASGKTESKQ